MSESLQQNLPTTEAAIEPTSKENLEEDVVDPWNVESKCDTGIDYDKLISKCFNARLIIMDYYI